MLMIITRTEGHRSFSQTSAGGGRPCLVSSVEAEMQGAL